MTASQAATLVAQLDAAQARLALLAAGSNETHAAELHEVRHQLAAIEAEVRTLTESGRRRTPTPSTLRSLLMVARADLAVELANDATPAQHLDRIVRLAQSLVPGTEHAGVSVLRRDAIETLAATGTVPAEVDEAQGGLGEGPSFHVQLMHGVVRINDTSTDTRWPKYAAQVSDLGLRSVLACEVPMTHTAPAVLSLYAQRRDAFSTAAELVVPVFAARAAVALAHAEEVSNLHRAIDSRQLIGEAVGILMERHRLSAEEAFGRLVAASQHRHVKLRELAIRMTQTGEEPESVTL